MSKLTDTLIKIAEMQSEIVDMKAEIGDEFDDGGWWEVGYKYTGCTENDGKLYNDKGVLLCDGGLVDEEYYCKQKAGWCEDDYSGTMYYKTDQEGVFVSVHYEC